MTRRWRKAHSPRLRVLGGGAAERSGIRSRVPTRERQRLPFWRETQPSSEIGKRHDNFAAAEVPKRNNCLPSVRASSVRGRALKSFMIRIANCLVLSLSASESFRAARLGVKIGQFANAP